jgi:hypothetical protein
VWGILLLAVALRVVVLFHSRPQDDAFITYRYVENLAEGKGFVYNLGERVYGTTTPLFTLMLVPFAWLGIPVEVAGIGLGIVADVLVCWLLFRWIGRISSPPAGLLAALFYASFYATVTAATYGMETQVFELFLLAALDLAFSRRYLLCALAGALALLTRPEGLLLVLLLGGVFAVRRLRGDGDVSWGAVGLFLSVVGAWLLFATLYFGLPVPQSLLAKAHSQELSFSEWTHFFFGRNVVVVFLWVGFVVGSVVAVVRRSMPLMTLAAWGLVYTVVFLIGKPAFLAAWYFPPTVLSLLALSAVGATAVGARILPRAAWHTSAVAVLWLGAMMIVLPRSLEASRWMRTEVDAVYRPLGVWLREHTEEDAVLYAGDIGYVGYLSKRRILDAAALVSPEVQRHYEEHASDPFQDVRLVLEKQPEVVVLRLSPGRYPRWKGSEFLDHYEPVRRFQRFGASELRPDGDPSLQYERFRRAHRSVADYIVYRRRTGTGA